MAKPPYSAASERNSEPIARVLQHELRDCGDVLEIGSGTGQHAVFMGGRMPSLRWQTSDLQDTHAWIRSLIETSQRQNVLPPLLLDMRAPVYRGKSFDAVYSSNTMHIMSEEAVGNMIPFVASVLKPGGRFCYYGPFKRGGQFTTESNEAFDHSLRAQDALMGLRELETIDTMAAANGLRQQRIYAMPANNLLIVWQRTPAPGK